MAYQQFLGQFAITDSSKDLSVGTDAIELTVGNYYVAGYTSEATAQLCEHLQAKIRAIGAGQDTSTVVYDKTTSGKITITLKTSASLNFDDAALGVILGFSSTNYAAGTIFIAENYPRYTWRPLRAVSGYPLNLIAATFWPPRSTSIVCRSSDGTTYGVEKNLVYDAVLNYFCLGEAETKTPSTGTVYGDLQQFWIDVVHAIRPMRIFLDRSLNGATDFITAMFGRESDEDGLGAFMSYAKRHIQFYNGYWNVEIPLMRHA
jgi:hypothetical protein